MAHILSLFAKYRIPAALAAMLAASTCAAFAIYKTTRPVVSTKLTLDERDDSRSSVADDWSIEDVEPDLAPGAGKTIEISGKLEIGPALALAFDPRGRLWLAERRSERDVRDELEAAAKASPPTTTPARPSEAGDRIVVLEDTNRDGRHDRRTVFVEGLKNLSSLEIGKDGVWVYCAPELLFIADANHDLTPDDKPTVVVDGFAAEPAAAPHASIRLAWGVDGKLYGCGFPSRSKPGKPGVRVEDRTAIEAGVWRLDPKTREIEIVAVGK